MTCNPNSGSRQRNSLNFNFIKWFVFLLIIWSLSAASSLKFQSKHTNRKIEMWWYIQLCSQICNLKSTNHSLQNIKKCIHSEYYLYRTDENWMCTMFEYWSDFHFVFEVCSSWWVTFICIITFSCVG